MKRGLGIRKISFFCGCILILGALALLAWWQLSLSAARKQSEEYLALLRRVIPEPEAAVLEARQDNTMAVLAADGADLIGILEFPAFGSAVPVCGDWDGTLLLPCRYAGSLYDGSLIIGATTQKGQFDFYRQIGVGDTLCFTDVTGSRYSYAVTDILHREHADSDSLHGGALTLFFKNSYASEYIILRCDALT